MADSTSTPKTNTSDDQPKGRTSPSAKRAAPAEDTTVAVTAEQRAAMRDPRVQQFPSLTDADNGEQIEVAERTIDLDTANEGSNLATDTHVKEFVTTQREWDSEDHDAVHERNMRAVRQYMLAQGLRTDAEVTVKDVIEVPSHREDRPALGSVRLIYEVSAVPAVVSTEFDTRHMVVNQTGPTATELAEYEASREQRIRDSHTALLGSPPATVTA